MYFDALTPYPKYELTTTFHDPVASKIKKDLIEVKDAIDGGLSTLLDEAKQLLENNTATEEEKKSFVEKLNALTKSASEATKGIESFGKGQQAELDMMDQAKIGNDKLDSWVEQAANHFKQSQRSVLRSIEVANEGGALSHVIDQWHEGETREDKRNSFMQRIGRMAVGIETLIDRVNSFPDRLAEAIVSGIENRKDAVNAAVKSWAVNAQDFYQKIEKDVDAVMKNTADTVGAAGDVAYNQIENISGSFGRGVQKNILNPLMNFLSDTAIPALKNAVTVTQDALFNQAKAISTDYREALHKRQEERAKETVLTAASAENTAHITPSAKM